MPIDATIPLAYHSPQIAAANPLETLGQVVSLRGLMQKGQLGALQLKQAEMELQERQNLAKLFAGGDPTAAPPTAPSQFDEPQLERPAGVPAPAAPAAPGGGFPTLGKILSVAPMTGLPIFKQFHEAHKAEIENQIKETELGQKQWEGRGAAAQAILDAKDPQAAFVPGIWDTVKRGLLTDAEARDILARGFNADELKRFASTAQDVKTQAETKLTDLKALGEGWTNAEKSLKSVHDQAGYDRLLPTLHPAVQQVLGPTYDPKMKTALGVPLTEQPKLFREQALSNGMLVAQALRESPEAAQAVIATFDPQQQQLFQDVKTPLEAQQRSLDPEKYITTERTVRQEMLGQTNKLRDDFLHTTEKFRDIRDAYSRVQAAKAGPPGGIQDIGLIYGYMKLVDPGSIVREGQAATVENASGVPDWVKNLYNKLLTGERLPDNTRAQVLSHVESIYGNAAKDQQAVEQDFTDRAKRYGVDPKDVIVPLGSTSAAKPEAAPEKTAGSTTPAAGPASDIVPAGAVREGKNGQMYMSRGGNRKDPKNWFPVTKDGGSWAPVRQ